MHELSPRQVCGILLAGGRSQRFGAEKAAAPFTGRWLMDSVLERFAGLAERAVNARAGSHAEARARALGLTVLHDAPGAPAGPLAGVAAGLLWAESRGFQAIATAPCDTPLLPPGVFHDLLHALADAPAAFAVTDDADHPLCALWRVGLRDRIEGALADGRHPPVRRLMAEIGARRVRFGDARAFANVNTRAALASLERAA